MIYEYKFNIKTVNSFKKANINKLSINYVWKSFFVIKKIHPMDLFLFLKEEKNFNKFNKNRQIDKLNK